MRSRIRIRLANQTPHRTKSDRLKQQARSPNIALLRNIVECHHKYKKIQFEDYQEKFVEPLSSGKTFPEHSEILAPTKINLPQYSMKLGVTGVLQEESVFICAIDTGKGIGYELCKDREGVIFISQ